MFHIKNVSDIYLGRNIIWWLLSAFKSGFINSAGFLLTGKFVSHVTGFSTQVGVAMGHADYFFGAELILIPIFFILGSAVSTLVLEQTSEKHPSYHLVQGGITALLALVVCMGEFNFFDSNQKFDIDDRYQFNEFFIISILCFISGAKNNLVTWTTYGKIRVTHMTGLSTDIGIHLFGMFNKKFSSKRFQEPRMINYLRIATLFCFSFGAFLSAMIFPIIKHKAFIIIFIISLTMTIYSYWQYNQVKYLKEEGNT